MKKLTWKGLSPVWLGMIMVLIIAACEKGPNFREFIYPAPIVEDFYPKQGYAGSLITIEGADFGTIRNAVKVYFGGVVADSTNHVEDNKIEVLVPEHAVSGKITVEIFGKQDTTKDELILLPSARVIVVDAERAQEGDEVTITGEHFGENLELVQVFIGEVEAQVISVTPTEVRFSVPDASSGNIILVVDGQRLTASYLLIGLEKLTGELIGHEGSWNNDPNTTIHAAVDGDIETAVDAASPSGYVGYDLGEGAGAVLSSVRYVPRRGNEARMNGGEIRGSNDPSLSTFTVLHEITSVPPTAVYTEVDIDATESYRYIYYYSASGHCNIAEIEFYGNTVEQEAVVGRYIWEFGTDGNDFGWEPQGATTWDVSGGSLNVTFPQTSGNKRADLRLTEMPVTLHTGDFPIFAMKAVFPAQPGGGNVVFDTNFGEFKRGGQHNNAYENDLLTDHGVYYWDISELLLQGEQRVDEEITFTGLQFKIADIPEDNPATGYTIEWIRTFESKEKLEEFLDN